MKLRKAIEIGTVYVEHLPPGVNEDWINALQILLGAGKRLQETRRDNPETAWLLLPGETID